MSNKNKIRRMNKLRLIYYNFRAFLVWLKIPCPFYIKMEKLHYLKFGN